ncbi:hypothetical protein BH11MYX4_BH11MYX4_05580 [soil metagenome]
MALVALVALVDCGSSSDGAPTGEQEGGAADAADAGVEGDAHVGLTVRGTVVDDTSNLVNGAGVMLDGDPSRVVTTGSAGTFEFADVTAPYTLTVKAGTELVEYRGLSRTRPQLPASGSGARYVAKLAGNVKSPAFPIPADQRLLLAATKGVVAFDFAIPTGAYDLAFQWAGSASVVVDLVALHVSIAVPGSIITSYWQTGTLPAVSLTNGSHQTGLDLSLSTPVSVAKTTLDYDPGAYSVGAGGSYLMVDAQGARFLAAALGATIPSGTELLLPADGATLTVSGSDADGNAAWRIGAAVLAGTTTLDLPVNTLLANGAPAKGAVGVSKTPTLSWTPVKGADFYAVYVKKIGALAYFLRVPGTSASVTLPDYTALGLPLQGNTTYTWQVIAFEASGVSVDSMTDPATAAFLTVGMYRARSMSQYSTASTTFTTAP